MKWPRIELWRLITAIALFKVSCGLAVAGWRLTGSQTEILWLAAFWLLGSAIGTLFRRGVVLGVVFACAAPLIGGLVIRFWL